MKRDEILNRLGYQVPEITPAQCCSRKDVICKKRK